MNTMKDFDWVYPLTFLLILVKVYERLTGVRWGSLDHVSERKHNYYIVDEYIVDLLCDDLVTFFSVKI